MATIVGAALCTQIPRLFILDPEARKAYMGDDVTTMYDAMEQLYTEKIAGLDVDTFLVVDTHWFTTIDYILNANEHLSGSYTSEELPRSTMTWRLAAPSGRRSTACRMHAAWCFWLPAACPTSSTRTT